VIIEDEVKDEVLAFLVRRDNKWLVIIIKAHVNMESTVKIKIPARRVTKCKLMRLNKAMAKDSNEISQIFMLINKMRLKMYLT